MPTRLARTHTVFYPRLPSVAEAILEAQGLFQTAENPGDAKAGIMATQTCLDDQDRGVLRHKVKYQTGPQRG